MRRLKCFLTSPARSQRTVPSMSFVCLTLCNCSAMHLPITSFMTQPSLRNMPKTICVWRRWNVGRLTAFCQNAPCYSCMTVHASQSSFIRASAKGASPGSNNAAIQGTPHRTKPTTASGDKQWRR